MRHIDIQPFGHSAVWIARDEFQRVNRVDRMSLLNLGHSEARRTVVRATSNENSAAECICPGTDDAHGRGVGNRRDRDDHSDCYHQRRE